MSLNSQSPYYTKTTDSTCSTVSLEDIKSPDSQYKLIYGTKEVINGNCPDNYHQLNNICYNSPPNHAEERSENPKIYECPKTYYIETKDGFDYTTCFTSDNCPKTFKFYSSNQCLDSCSNTLKKETNDDTIIFRCSDDCIINSDNDYEVEYKIDNIRYCLDECPSEAKYHYNSDIVEDSIKYKCLEKCNVGHFSKDNICVSTCDNDKIILDVKQKTYSCSSDCPNNFPYLYELLNNDGSIIANYCLKSCKDTYNETLFPENNVKTYLFDENGIKKCQANKPETGNYYKDEISLKWVMDCKVSPSGPFHDEESCRNSCEGFDCVTNDNFQCINIIDQNEYYLEETENICYKSCPEYLNKGFYNNDKKCTSCSDGFYRAGDKKCSSSYSEINTNSEPQGNTQFYINFGDNFCFENGCINNPFFRFKKVTQGDTNENPIICYQSCFNISNAKYEIDNDCYIDQPSDISDEYYYYTIIRGTDSEFTKYTKFSDECIVAGFPYLNEDTKECKSDCGQNYKILPTRNQMGKCYTLLNNCKDSIYKYYNGTDKICTEKCEVFSVVDINGDLINNNENCLINCPDNYCEDTKNKLCYTKCKN